MKIFYAPEIENFPVLSEEESAHCVRVLRLKKGDEATVCDGNGAFFNVKILAPDVKKTQVEILQKTIVKKPDFSVNVAIAPTKNMERLEWFVEKATEIGIDSITPILCRFSERKTLNLERLERILISAAKQSGSAFLPKLFPLISVKDSIKNCTSQAKFIAHCYADEQKKFLLSACPKTASVTVMIGPEGDFSQEEVAFAKKENFLPVSLGESRLRTETAGIVACHIVNLAQKL